jgi:hypothetical protein
MPRYFLFANFWAVAAVLVYIGKTTMRNSPDRFAVFGVGRWFGQAEYATLILVLIALSVVHFAVYARSRRRGQPEN